MERLEYFQIDEIKNLLIGKSIKKLSSNTLLLNDNTVLHIVPNRGCACGAGDYSLSKLNELDNVITDVEFDYSYKETEGCYKIFVVSGNRNLLLQVDGDDGNGYYGSGFEIVVMKVGDEVEERR